MAAAVVDGGGCFGDDNDGGDCGSNGSGGDKVSPCLF